MLTDSKVMTHFVVLYIFGDLDLNLGPILTKFLLFQLDDRPDAFGKFEGDCSMVVDARAQTDKQTNKQTRNPDRRSGLCESYNEQFWCQSDISAMTG